MADVGYSYQGSCFQTEAAARSEQCQTAYPQSGSTGTGSYVVSCTGPNDTGLSLVRTESAASASAFTIETSYPSCYVGVIGRDPFTAAQASEAFGWGFTGVMLCYLVAWGCGRILEVIGWD